jgi:GH24 family phage-related lysozyme (muramidase)
MRLVDDWRRVVSRSLSFWLLIFGILVMVLPEVRYGLTGHDYDPFLAWWTGILLLVAAAGGRLIHQGLRWWQEALRIIGFIIVVIALAFLFAAEVRAAPASEADTLEIAVPFIAREEGERLVAYRDALGIPTIGFGHTDGVRMGMTITHRQALDMLRSDVAEHRAGLHRYFTPATVEVRLPPTRDAAYTSTAFNCGVTAIGKSTATRRLNAGNIAGGCEALTWWNRAGNRVLRGLFERRKREQALCMQGL